MIAMALACDPELIIADEPTTALDVVVQAQVLDVLNGLVRDRELTLVMISHDLAVLAAVCERIVVMRNGRMVEQGKAQQILTAPVHEHTRELAAAFPVIGDPASRLVVGSRSFAARRRRAGRSRLTGERSWRSATSRSTSAPAASTYARSTTST